MPISKVLIVDDEKPARTLIKLFIEKLAGYELVGEAENGFEGIKLTASLSPDILILDVQMPKLTGFEMLELIDKPPAIIFSTAYDAFAIKAFEQNAADYLLKPYTKERFQEALVRARKSVGLNQKPLMEKISDSAIQNNIHRVVVKDGSRIEIIPVDEISYILAQDDYCEIHCKRGKFLKQQTMKKMELALDPQLFVRVHRSSIIKVSEIVKIEKYGKETFLANLKNDAKVTVSASGYAKLKGVLGW